MKPFVQHTGLVAPIDRVNVDTDQIIPKQFLKGLTREGLGRVLFYDWRYLEGEQPNPAFVLNQPPYQGASILLGRDNFGCGSSREHAAWALSDYGIRAIIAPRFADIFSTNCFKNGLLLVTLPADAVDGLFHRAEREGGLQLTVDLVSETVTGEPGLSFPFKTDPFRRECLLEGLDDIGLTLRREADIGAYEKTREPRAVNYEATVAADLRPSGPDQARV